MVAVDTPPSPSEISDVDTSPKSPPSPPPVTPNKITVEWLVVVVVSSGMARGRGVKNNVVFVVVGWRL